jgi:hypothetical protein
MRAGCTRLFLLSLAVLILPAGAPAASSQKDKNKNAQHTDHSSGVDTHVAVDVFVGRDRDVIRRYYSAHPASLPPGLEKRGGDLPPGLEKQLQRKGHLPPGLDKRVVAFPVELERQLPPLKSGLVRGVIEGRAVIFNPKTSLVLDACLVF